jgi:hypothetical protein
MVIRIALADLVCFRQTSLMTRLNPLSSSRVNLQTIQEILKENQPRIQISPVENKKCSAIYSTNPIQTNNRGSIDEVIKELKKSRESILETSKIIQESGIDNSPLAIESGYIFELDPTISSANLNKKNILLWANNKSIDVPSYSLKLTQIIFQTLKPVYDYLLNPQDQKLESNTMAISQENQLSIKSLYNSNLEQLELALTFIQGTINGIKRTIEETILAIDSITAISNFRLNSADKIIKKANYPTIFDALISKCKEEDGNYLIYAQNKSFNMFYGHNENSPFIDKNNKLTTIQEVFKTYFNFFKKDIEKIASPFAYNKLETLANKEKAPMPQLISQADIYHPSMLSF